MATEFLILLALAVGMIFVKCSQRRLRLEKLDHRNGCRSPSRLFQWDRIFGIDTLVESSWHIKSNTYLPLLQHRFAKYGNTYSFSSLGATTINTIDPENIQAMLAKRFNDFGLGSGRKEAFEPLIGHGIFTADGPAWQEARKLIRRCFNWKEMHDVSVFEEHVGHFLCRIPRDGRPLDLQGLFRRFSIDVATEFLFGQSTKTLHACKGLPRTSGTMFATTFDRAQRTIAYCFALGPLAFLVPKKQFRKDQELVHEFVDHYIRDVLLSQSRDRQKGTNKSAENGRYQFLREFSSQARDYETLRGGLLHLLLAGRDSTASLLGNMWFMLARHPRVWKKLQEEVATLSGSKPTYEGLKKLKYLRQCINESLRLHPVVPINYRTSLRPTILPTGGGTHGKSPICIPTGTVIGYFTSALHRRTDIYGPDAHEFKPERWDTIRPGWAFLPFNGGARVCLGQGFAMKEVAYLTVRICQVFDGIEGLGDREWRESLSLTCQSRDGCWVSLRPREVGVPWVNGACEVSDSCAAAVNADGWCMDRGPQGVKAC